MHLRTVFFEKKLINLKLFILLIFIALKVKGGNIKHKIVQKCSIVLDGICRS